LKSIELESSKIWSQFWKDSFWKTRGF